MIYCYIGNNSFALGGIMNLSIFWARLLGLFTVILCAGMQFHATLYNAFTFALIKEPEVMMVMGIFTLLFGLFIVVSHSIWKGWPILVTVVGYLVTIKGIILAFHPQHMVQIITKIGSHVGLSTLPAFVLGLVLIYFGYFKKQPIK